MRKNKYNSNANIVGDVFKNWSIDQKFLNAAMSELNESTTVSFDIFDTALTRHFDSPADMFAEVELYLCQEYGTSATGYAGVRERAEQLARHRQHKLHGAEEVTLQQIYQEISNLLPSFNFWKEAVQAEIEAEKNCLHAVPDILELTRKLNKVGRKYIFVSDMYLPREILHDLLNSAGFENWQDIYVSSEHNATKATGRIWEMVGVKYPIHDILHIGDNKQSDIINPRNYGIKTLEFNRVRSQHRCAVQLSPDMLPFSRLNRTSTLNSRSDPMNKPNRETEWNNIGRTMGGAVLGSFVHWLAERVSLHKIERLYFCARDGYLIKRAWEAAGFDKIISASTHYLYVSRASLNVAAGILESTPDKLSQSLLNFLGTSAGRTTVEVALRRVDLIGLDLLVKDITQSIGPLDTVLSNTEIVHHFEGILQKHSRKIIEKLSPRYKVCIDYLKQEGILDNGKQAIVDMGWHGSMQRSLRKLLAASGGPTDLVGFYYGLWPAAKSNRFASGVMESFFANEFEPLSSRIELHQGVAILEQLHSAPHGSTAGYRVRDDNLIVPVLSDNPLELQQHNHSTRWFQEGALDFISSAFMKQQDDQSMKLPLFTKEAALSALASVILSPSAVELDLLSTIGHCATFDHESHEPIIRRDMPVDLKVVQSTYVHSDWKIGQLQMWWQTADAQQKAIIRELAQADELGFDSRILRQFS